MMAMYIAIIPTTPREGEDDRCDSAHPCTESATTSSPSYLIDTPDGITLIDAGLAGQWRELTAELTAMGRSIGDIRGVVLTHGDTDHIGFAERLRRDHGVPVFVHEADAARARGEVSTKPEWGHVKLGATTKFLWYALTHGGVRTTHLAEVVTVRDGEVLDLPGSPRIIGMPGHSPGSIAVHVPAADAVFVGDALTTRHVLTGAAGPQPAPFTDDPAEALASLRRLEGSTRPGCCPATARRGTAESPRPSRGHPGGRDIRFVNFAGARPPNVHVVPSEAALTALSTVVSPPVLVERAVDAPSRGIDCTPAGPGVT